MRKGYFTSPKNLAALTKLEKDFHAELGNDLTLKFYKVIPNLKKDSQSALGWIIHNQQEVIGRCERYKLSLHNLVDEMASPNVDKAFANCLAAIDHIRQNLTFLVGEHTPTAGYYTVDSELNTLVITRQRAAKHFKHLIDSKRSKVISNHLARKFGRFCNHIKKLGCPSELANNAKEQVKVMLNLFDLYYTEVESLIESPKNPTIMLYRFRRVQSVAMELLSAVILAQALTETIWYLYAPRKTPSRKAT